MLKLHRTARIPRKTSASRIKKMQVPTYWPTVDGAQLEEYRGVLLAVKKTIIMSDMPIMVDAPESSIPGIEEVDVAEGIAMLMLAVLLIAVDVADAMVMPLMSLIDMEVMVAVLTVLVSLVLI